MYLYSIIKTGCNKVNITKYTLELTQVNKLEGSVDPISDYLLREGIDITSSYLKDMDINEGILLQGTKEIDINDKNILALH